METCKSIPQVGRPGNLYETETIITVKFQDLRALEIAKIPQI